MEDLEIKILLRTINNIGEQNKDHARALANFIGEYIDPDYNGCFTGDIGFESKEFIFNVIDGELIALDVDCNEYDPTDIHWQ